jgi:hypothetical protein
MMTAELMAEDGKPGRYNETLRHMGSETGSLDEGP